jgi:hypothetical protein
MILPLEIVDAAGGEWLVRDLGIGERGTRRTLGQRAGQGHAGREHALKGWHIHGTYR